MAERRTFHDHKNRSSTDGQVFSPGPGRDEKRRCSAAADRRGRVDRRRGGSARSVRAGSDVEDRRRALASAAWRVETTAARQRSRRVAGRASLPWRCGKQLIDSAAAKRQSHAGMSVSAVANRRAIDRADRFVLHQ